jgi:sugar lactone lactonase YvrE
VSLDGLITSLAGDGTESYSGDGGPAVNAQLNHVAGAAADDAGNVYIADWGNARIRKVAPDGTITTAAGGGQSGHARNRGTALLPKLTAPIDLTLDRLGNLYFVDSCRIRKMSTAGLITTVAGNRTCYYSGDGGPAIVAGLGLPQGIAVDTVGNLYISEAGSNRVRRVSTDGTISTFAGNGTAGYSGDGGWATAAQLFEPAGLAVDGAGNLLIADTQNHRIRKISADGLITTVVGNGTWGYSGDRGLATSAQLNRPTGLAIDDAANLFIAECGNTTVRKFPPVATSQRLRETAHTDTPAMVDPPPARNSVVQPGSLWIVKDGST